MYCNKCIAEQDYQKDKKITCASIKCNNFIYLNPKLAALAIVIKTDTILLVKRDIMPNYNKWSLPAGYVNFGESPEKAVVREVFEETNINITVNKLITANYNEDSKVTVLCYKAYYESGDIKIGEECKDVRFFNINDLPDLPFEYDNELVKLSIKE
jgi:ADP-ribose pyrophosphatase YjhB (NUDIX family)